MAQIDILALLEQTTDQDSRLVQNFKVVGVGLNVESVKFAYTADGKRLPQRGEKNPYMDSSDATVVDKIRVSITATEEGGESQTYRVSITYAPQEEASANRRDPENPDNFRFPWDMPAEMSITNNTMTVDMWGTDTRGQPLLYSNGEAVQLTRELPLTVLNIQRVNRLDRADNGIKLNEQFFQTVNSSPVDITVGGQTTSWNSRELLCASVDVVPSLFSYTDPVTGKFQSYPIAQENITLIGNKHTWATRIVDQGNMVRDDEDNLVEVYNENKVKVNGPHLLNGVGKGLLDVTFNASGLRDIKNAYNGSSTTGNGIAIDSQAITAAFGSASNARAVFLGFLTYEEKAFTQLRINERLP